MKKKDIEQAIATNPQQVFTLDGHSHGYGIIDGFEHLPTRDRYSSTKVLYAIVREVYADYNDARKPIRIGNPKRMVLTNIGGLSLYTNLEQFHKGMIARQISRNARELEKREQATRITQLTAVVDELFKHHGIQNRCYGNGWGTKTTYTLEVNADSLEALVNALRAAQTVSE